MRLVSLLIALVLVMAAPLRAQDFSPVITVGDRAITAYELDQRARLLTLFRTPGNPSDVAREQLIDDRLKQILLDRAGLQITPEALQEELVAFAGRANLSLDQFLQILAQSGVPAATLRDFVQINVSWRDYVRSRFGSRVNVTDADVDRALGNTGGAANIEVLLSEIIIAAPPPRAAQANAIAADISQTRSEQVFSNAARRYSALPSRGNGGRLGWLPISNYPPALQGLILGLGRLEVTPPIPITNGVALFQMRGVRETQFVPPTPASIEYAAFYMPGAGTEAGLSAARQLQRRIDTCDDLYGAAKGLPDEQLERVVVAPADIPQDFALELARLDRNEASFNVTRGNSVVFLMLCNRLSEAAAGADRDAVRTQIRSQRLAGFADALLSDIRSSVRIEQ